MLFFFFGPNEFKVYTYETVFIFLKEMPAGSQLDGWDITGMAIYFGLVVGVGLLARIVYSIKIDFMAYLLKQFS